MADEIRCAGKRRFLGFLWKMTCGYPLASKKNICWVCGTYGPEHPTRLFWDELRSSKVDVPQQV